MGVRITQMDPLQGSLDKHDLFEMARPNGTTGGTTYSVTAEQVADYYKRKNNGAYLGTSDKAMDDFTYSDAGVYYWAGTPPLSGMPSAGLLEIMTYVPPEDVSGEAPFIIQRFSAGGESFIRSKLGAMWSSWGVLANKNGNVIFSGTATETQVTFPIAFEKPPVVTVTPVNSGGTAVYVINLQTVTNTGFSVWRFSSDLTAVVTEVEETQDGNKTTERTETTRGAWANENVSFPFHWIATVDG